jgi:hypothetical protein
VNCLGDGAEYHTGFREFFAEGRGDGDGIEYRIHGDTGEHFLLVQRDAQLFVGASSSGSTSSRLFGLSSKLFGAEK